MIRLDKRLSAIYAKIPSCVTLCDIGCDHGKLCVKAVLEARAERAVAVDVSLPSLKKAEDLARQKGVYDKIDFRCSDGFDAISKEEADVCVIAGMGGLEISEILKRRKYDFVEYVFAPHSHATELRRYLNGRFFVAEDEKICVGKHFYDIIKCKVGKSLMSEREIYFGKSGVSEPDFAAYIKKRAEILRSLAASVAEPVRLAEIKRELTLAEAEL